MERTDRAAMRLKDMTPEQLKAHQAAIGKKWREKDGDRRREYNRNYYRGTHKLWWTNACRKAGVVV